MKTFQPCGYPRRSKRLQSARANAPTLVQPPTLSPDLSGGNAKSIHCNQADGDHVSDPSRIYSGQYLVDYCYRNWSRWAQEARDEAKRLRTLDPPCTLSGPAGEESVQMLADRLTRVIRLSIDSLFHSSMLF